MTTVDDMFEIALFAIRKNGGQGDLSPTEFNTLINQSQNSFVDYLKGEFQQYQYQHPQPRIQYSQNRNIRQSLTPIIYGYNLSINSVGFSPYPGDYIGGDAMWTYYGVDKVTYVQQQYFASYYKSVIDPYQTNPFFLIEDTGFRFYPASLGAARLSYIREPRRIIWGYDEDENGLPVYNESLSQQPEWADTDILQILVRMLRLVGVNLELPQVSQYANEIKTQGQ